MLKRDVKLQLTNSRFGYVTLYVVSLKVTFTERNFEYGLVFTRHLVRLNVVSELLLVVNSSANFVVYVAFGRRFRRILRDTFQFSFRFSGGGTALTHDAHKQKQQQQQQQGGAVAAQRLQYHHNCVHVHKLHHSAAPGVSQPHCRTAVIR